MVCASSSQAYPKGRKELHFALPATSPSHKALKNQLQKLHLAPLEVNGIFATDLQRKNN